MKEFRPSLDSQGKNTADPTVEERLELLEAVFSNTHFLLAYMDTDFNFIRVNRAYAASVGQAPEFFEGRNHFELFPHTENLEIFRLVVETGRPYTITEKPFEYPGRPGWGVTYWDWSLDPIKDEAGSVKGVLLGLVDVTQKVVNHQELLKSKRHYQQTLQQSLDGFARIDMDNRFIEANSAFLDMVGYSLEELRGLRVQDITPEHYFQMERGMLQELLKVGHTPLYEKEYLHKDGFPVPVELRVYVSFENDMPEEMWAFVKDVTDKKKQEVERETYLQALKKSNRELEEFAYVASHDLQDPLRKIHMFGDRVLRNYGEALDERGRDYLERMVGASHRMRNLISALLDYSRVTTKTKPFRPVDMNEVLEEVLNNLEFRVEQTGARVDVGHLPTVLADDLQMVQLMQNLVANALKFQNPGSVPRIEVAAKTVNGRSLTAKGPGKSRETFVEFRVADNGIGFDEKHFERILMPFERLHGKGRYEGVGMGLAICRKIVERHHGTIRAKSEKGKGTIFLVSLPLSEASESRV